jgi:hypothetical protein
MDEERFGSYLKRGGRSPSAVGRCVRHIREFERYLGEEKNGLALDEAGEADLEEFVAWIERDAKRSAKSHLWALGYYFEFTENVDLNRLAGVLREQRIKRRPLSLARFQGVPPERIERLAEAGIKNVDQMLQAGQNASARKALAEKTGVSVPAILELVKLSDLARIPGVKGVRARLFYEAGVDTVEKLADWDPQVLRAALVAFVAQAGFGTAPLPKETAFSVTAAQRLPRVVDYSAQGSRCDKDQNRLRGD